MFHIIRHIEVRESVEENVLMDTKECVEHKFLVEDTEDNKNWWVVYHYDEYDAKWVRYSYTVHSIWIKEDSNVILRSYETHNDFIGDHFEDFL